MGKNMQVNNWVFRFRNLFFVLPFLFLFSCTSEENGDNKNAENKNGDKAMRAGGWSDAPITDEWIRNAAEFAVKAKQEEMRKTETQKSASLKLVKILNAKQQVVAGMNYDLKLQAEMDATNKIAKAIVWRQLSGDFKLTSWNWE